MSLELICWGACSTSASPAMCTCSYIHACSFVKNADLQSSDTDPAIVSFVVTVFHSANVEFSLFECHQLTVNGGTWFFPAPLQEILKSENILAR